MEMGTGRGHALHLGIMPVWPPADIALNEAFADQALAIMQQPGLDDKTNLQGGVVALK